MATGGYFIELTIDDGRTVERTIHQFEMGLRAISDLSVPFEQIGEGLLEDNWNNFAENGALYAGAVGQHESWASYTEWAPLAPSTVLDRERRGYGPGPTLVREGILRDSLTRRGAWGNVFEVTSGGVQVGTRDPIATYQHYGTSRIPPRTLVGVTWYRRRAIVRTLGDYIRDELNRGI